MATNLNLERLYELLEQFDFKDLSEDDKIFVLTVLSETEYVNIRNTLKETNDFYADVTEPNLDKSINASIIYKSRKENRILQIIKQPVPLYKVAASILIIFVLTSVFFQVNIHKHQNFQAYHDTIFIKNTDTMVVRLIDTVKLITSKIVYVNQNQNNNIKNRFLASSNIQADCKKEICPDDVDAINNFSLKNNIANDTVLSDFIVAIK